MIDNNVDQDEWFNLYLCLGSCWVNKSIRYSIRYRIQSPELTKESRSIDRAENLTELKGVSTQKSSWIPKFTNQESRHKVGLKSRRLRTRITPKPVPRSLTERSVCGRSLHSSSSTGSIKVQDPVCVVSLRRIDRFFQPIFSKSNIR
jgi:hypothetical protein